MARVPAVGRVRAAGRVVASGRIPETRRPAAFAGLAGWWRGDDLTTGATWPDASLRGRPLLPLLGAPTVIPNAIEGHTSARFNGVNQSMQAMFPCASLSTVIMVYKSISIGGTGANDGILDGGVFPTRGFIEDNSPHAYLYQGAVMGALSNFALGAYAVAVLVFGGLNAAMYKNGVLFAAGSAVATTAPQPQGITVGSVASGARPSNIEVAEMLLFDYPMAIADWTPFNNTFRSKYGI